MKKYLFYLFALVCTMSFFTACSDDDDPVYPIDEELAGTYKGTLDIELDQTPVGTGLPKNITIAKAGNDVISLELKDFSFMEMNLGTIKLEKCVLKQDGTSYLFIGNQELDLAGIGKCAVTVTGTLNNGTAVANLDITVAQLKQNVKVVYKGTKLSGSESSAAVITAFTIDSDVLTEQPVIVEDKGTITFKVNAEAADADLKSLKPTFVVSEKATVIPASGVVQDFSNGKTVTYTVIAEDGTVKTYTASVAGRQNVLKYSFEEWEKYGDDAELPLPRNELGSSSEGAALLAGYGKGIPVYKTDDKVDGQYAIKLMTVDLSEYANSLIPAITSGSVFTGKFDMMPAILGDRLSCTRFGIPYDKKPLRFKGWYKYTPGTKFLDGSAVEGPEDVVEVPGKIDECAIQAVLYEAVDADGKEVTLTGHDINSSEYRVATAVLADGTAKAEYTEFDLAFTYLDGKTYDAGKTYKLAIVCSSSKEGDFFKGAGGSTLIMDELEVIGE